MSTLSDKTEYKVLRIIAKMIVTYQEYSDLKMTKEDDFDACKAIRLLNRIVESNGYRICSDKKHLLKKNKLWKRLIFSIK